MITAGRRAITAFAALGGAGAVLATCGIAPADAAATSGVATTTVNIRTAASTSSVVVGRLVRGQKITVTGSAAGDWVQVRFRGTTAYVDRDYLTAPAHGPPRRVPSRPPAPRSPPRS